MATFGALDYVVFGLMLLISSGIGIYYRCSGGRQKTASEYLLADRNMNIVPVAFSLMANFMSGITLLGVSAEHYSYGTMFVLLNFIYGALTPVAAYLYLPVFFNLGATSVYEYLELRFGSVARLAASLAFSLQMVLYMGIVLYAPALALEVVTGLPRIWAILSVGFVCTFYSVIGGLKAVLVTDVFQSFLMFAAVFCVIISAWIDTGSLSKIWEIAEKHGRIEFDNIDPDPTVRHTWWNLILGGSVNFLSLYAVNQAQVQRYLAVKDLKTAQRSLWWSWPLLLLLGVSTGFSGLAIFSKYADCDPLKSGKISASDQLMPYYVVDTMGHLPGLSGLFVCGIFSAALSTVSGAVNSLAAVTLEDYVKPVYKRLHKNNFEDVKSSFQAKLISLFYGLVCIAIAFVVEYLGSILQASLTIFGLVGGPILGLFTLGMAFPFANQTGAVVGFVVSFAYSAWVGFAPKPPALKLPVSIEGCVGNFSASILTPTTSPVTSNDNYFYLYRLSYMWLGFMGFVLCIVIGSLMSFIASHILHLHLVDESDSIDPNLFMPPVASYLRRRQENVCSRSSGKKRIEVQVNAKKPNRDGDSDSISSHTRLEEISRF